MINKSSFVGYNINMNESLFTKQLNKIMEERGMTAADVCRRSVIVDPDNKGIPLTTISRWTRGVNTPAADKLSLLAEVLDVDVSYFYLDDDSIEGRIGEIEAVVSAAYGTKTVEMMRSFTSMNIEGQAIAGQIVEDLSALPKYKKQ